MANGQQVKDNGWRQGSFLPSDMALRQLTGADVLTASHDLRKLRELKLVSQKGKGSATYYLPGPLFPAESTGHTTLPAKHTTLPARHTTLCASDPERPTISS